MEPVSTAVIVLGVLAVEHMSDVVSFVTKLF